MLAYQQISFTNSVDSQAKLPSIEHIQKMSDKVKEQIKNALEKLSLIYKWTNSNASSVQCRQLLRQYQDTVWPLLIEVDERLKELSIVLRRCIDSCRLGDAKLDILLSLKRQQVEFASICLKLTDELNTELSDVLELRSRSIQVHGIELREESTKLIEQFITQTN